MPPKEQQAQADEAAHAKERKIQEAMLGIKKKYGKNAILKGMNLEEGATARERNQTDRRASGMSGKYDDILHLPHPTSNKASPDVHLGTGPPSSAPSPPSPATGPPSRRPPG